MTSLGKLFANLPLLRGLALRKMGSALGNANVNAELSHFLTQALSLKVRRLSVGDAQQKGMHTQQEEATLTSLVKSLEN
jgi:hypothetical protein